jgi:hypothetical protein
MLMPYGYVTDKTNLRGYPRDPKSKIIKRIFQDHWDEFLREHKYKIPEEMQSSVIDAVSKMLICGTKEMGYAMYLCTNCSQHPEITSLPVKAVSAPPAAKYMSITG